MNPDPLLLSQALLTGFNDQLRLDPRQFWGIPIALIGAALLSFGAQYQSRGLNKVERLTGKSASAGLSFRHISSLFHRPSWVVGTAFLSIATVFQIVSLGLSPLIVVQPIGVVALVITAILNSRYSGIYLGRRAKFAIAMCVAGIVVFVTIAAFTATDRLVTDKKLITILILFAAVFVAIIILYFVFRNKGVALLYIIGAGVLYGFVATFAKTVIGRLQQGEFEMLTWSCVAALIVGAIVGMVFVQNAYSSGPPDLVVAGLTVIDPLIAVLIGITVLGEAAQAPLWAVIAFAVSASVAMVGVYGLAKYHPQSGLTTSIVTNAGDTTVIKP